MNQNRTHRTDIETPRVAHAAAPQRRVIAVGKRENGRWKVRTSLWRYLLSTAISQ